MTVVNLNLAYLIWFILFKQNRSRRCRAANVRFVGVVAQKTTIWRPIDVSLTRRVSYKAGPNCKMDLAVT